MKVAYTPAEDLLILKLRADGLTRKQIAARLGRTDEAIKSRLYQMDRVSRGHAPRTCRPAVVDAPVDRMHESAMVDMIIREGGMPWIRDRDGQGRHIPPQIVRPFLQAAA